uniref:Headcase N-terminal domain-containing protein n=1 Tax=Anopheles minimus TaxID=112268 RepID=A0A182W0A8_9DIPT
MAPLRAGRTAVSEGLIQHPSALNQSSITSIGGVYDPFSWGVSGDSDHGFESSQSGDGSGSEGAGMVRCCMPIGECMKPKGGNPFSELGAMINLEDLRECVRVQCSNESCTAGQYMHRECFDRWEDEVLAFLKSTARARSWSDKQRQQYLWTKKGYDLVHKMCACKCGRGNLKKDLDWNAPTTATMFGRALVGNGGGGIIVGDGSIDVGGLLGPIGGREDESAKKQKKKKNRHNQKLAISTSASSSANSSATSSPNSQQQLQQQHQQSDLILQQHHHLLQQQQQQQHQNNEQQHQLKLLSLLSKISVTTSNGATPMRRGTNHPPGLGGLVINGMHSQLQQQQQHHLHHGATIPAGMISVSASARMRANSLSSISNGSCTPPASSIGGSEQSISPIHNQAPSPASIAKLPLTPKSKVELYSERVR